ncbi:hypothetical protein V496_01108 [Pseudogymnoascus sp. VKM F-4515 (FW-2607)]|nr:hypothetical protein V496_01108 [Pseudogymnoascus sp. VKM F-4515 (FW-2607)]
MVARVGHAEPGHPIRLESAPFCLHNFDNMTAVSAPSLHHIGRSAGAWLPPSRPTAAPPTPASTTSKHNAFDAETPGVDAVAVTVAETGRGWRRAASTIPTTAIGGHAPPTPEAPSSVSPQTNYAAPSIDTSEASPEAGPSRSSPYAHTLRSSSTTGPQTPQSTYAPSLGPAPTQPPQQPPRPQPQQAHSAALTGWQPLFNNTAPTAFGAAFFNEIFNHLDVNRTGLLVPEQYSAFLDIIGYSLDQNAWKNQMSKPVFGYNPQDFADYQLRQEYINLSVDHVMAPRPPAAPNTDLRSSFSSLRNIIPPSLSQIFDSIPTGNSISGNQMPLLTRRGFIDICATEFLYYPNAGFSYVTKAVRHYGIWREFGDVPRNVMPAVAPQELIDRVKIINIEATRKAEELLAAKTVETNLAAMGRRNAVNLTDDSRPILVKVIELQLWNAYVGL